MSHVIGQGTIASNHYRTSEYRASEYHTPQEFNSETVEFNANAGRGAKKAILKALKETLIPAMKNFDGVGAAGKKWAKATDEEFEVAIKKILDADNFDELVGEGASKKVWLKKLLKGEVDPAQLNNIAKSLDGVDNLIAPKKLSQAAADATEEVIQKSDVSPLTKRVMTTGALVTTTLGGFALFLNSDALESWVANNTGMNCGEKAADRNLDPDTPEYTAAVQGCQEGVASNLLKLGYGALAIVGFVGLVAVTRAIPKKKAPKEDSEDEE